MVSWTLGECRAPGLRRRTLLSGFKIALRAQHKPRGSACVQKVLAQAGDINLCFTASQGEDWGFMLLAVIDLCGVAALFDQKEKTNTYVDM